MSFEPFTPGDIVEHEKYPGAAFELGSFEDQVFSTHQFCRLALLGFTGQASEEEAEVIQEELDDNDGVLIALTRHLRRPENGMMVLGLIAKQAEHEDR
jgi:hypothetical protein